MKPLMVDGPQWRVPINGFIEEGTREGNRELEHHMQYYAQLDSDMPGISPVICSQAGVARIYLLCLFPKRSVKMKGCFALAGRESGPGIVRLLYIHSAYTHYIYIYI